MSMGRIRNKTKSNPIIGILCEGESEKQYFTMLKQKYRLANIKVKIVAADLSGKREPTSLIILHMELILG